MAKVTKASEGAEAVTYRLKSSFGYIEGSEHKLLPKGSLLNTGEHSALITKIAASGGQIEQVEPKA